MASPCIKECSMVNGFCTGCLRTSEEISNWRLMPVPERMEIMKQLKGQVFTHDCPGCGKGAYCAMEAGKSASACWCMSVGTKEVKPETADQGESCYCRSCLIGESNKGVQQYP